MLFFDSAPPRLRAGGFCLRPEAALGRSPISRRNVDFYETYGCRKASIYRSAAAGGGRRARRGRKVRSARLGGSKRDMEKEADWPPENHRRGYPTIPVFYHSTIPRQTNPISGRAEGRTSAVWIRSCDEWDTGKAVKKQSQFGGLTKLDAEADETRDDHGRDGRGTHGQDAHATERFAASLRTGLLRQTNPISATVPIRRSAVPGANCAEQTQFRRERFRGQVLCR